MFPMAGTEAAWSRDSIYQSSYPGVATGFESCTSECTVGCTVAFEAERLGFLCACTCRPGTFSQKNVSCHFKSEPIYLFILIVDAFRQCLLTALQHPRFEEALLPGGCVGMVLRQNWM